MASPNSEPINLSGQVALVTGAARGIGQAVAKTLAREGADLIVSDLKDTQETENAIKNMGRSVVGLNCDVSKKNSVMEMVQAGIRQYEHIDILVSCAGITGGNFLGRDISELSETEWDSVLNANLKGTFFMIQALLPHMKARKWGKIVCIGSLAAKIGGVYSGPHYAASKGGIHSLIKWACKDGAGASVFVNGIAPGPVQTEMIKGMTYPENLLPLNRLGTVEDIAEATLFLASQASNWMTGIVLDVNGGFFIG